MASSPLSQILRGARWAAPLTLLLAACGGDPAPLEGAGEGSAAAGGADDSPVAAEASASQGAGGLGAGRGASPNAGPSVELLDPDMLEAFPALAAAYPGPDGLTTAEQIGRGEQWFRSTALSSDGTRSCASCHQMDQGGDDGLALSQGPGGVAAPRNAPSLWNVGSYTSLGWDGRAGSVEDYTALHLLDPWATGFSEAAAVEAAAGEGVAFDQIVADLSAYQRSLVRHTRWDRFLAGDGRAVTEAERQGFDTFVEVGCTMCHTGPSFGGDDLQILGMADDWPDLQDQGRAALTGDADDEAMFRTAPLRGLSDSAPYGHAGQVEDLGQMIQMMAEYQLGGELEDEEVAAILEWLEAISGSDVD